MEVIALWMSEAYRMHRWEVWFVCTGVKYLVVTGGWAAYEIKKVNYLVIFFWYIFFFGTLIYTIFVSSTC